MNLTIDLTDVEKSFDRIATEILTSKALLVNDKLFFLTEIEFYYFHKEIHEDKYTHEHQRDEGEWRFHNQGLDITLKSSDIADGGILLRGVLEGNKYTNGPRKVIGRIFEGFSKVTAKNEISLITTEKRTHQIIKTNRHLPNKNRYEDFVDRPYRYLVDLDNLDMTISNKEKIRANSTAL